ncbi:SAM-dependent methyltransferase [Larkinella bovis]|uniref:SAM-dependent methyltransferase n=1 Tax=Larkinella bovis TaxID=683041 RepID=A0ABW0I6T0_9BACT
MPVLYLIPTILAENTADQVLSPQIRDVISQTTVFFVENVRTARRFISSLKTGVVIDELTFYDLHKDTPETDTRQQLQALKQQNRDAGILSEAGCPGVADPGAVAVRLAHQSGWQVRPLVGPSSILLALMASGMSGQSFAFHGYLPIEKPARLHEIRQLEQEARKRQQTQIFMETPYRNNQLLADLLATCHPETRLCIACNLTAPDELVRTRTIREWKAQSPDLHKKPSLFLIL